MVSSGSKAVKPSDRHALVGGGVARSTGEAGQRPRREGATQDSLFGESNTAAPEAEPTVSTKLAEQAVLRGSFPRRALPRFFGTTSHC